MELLEAAEAEEVVVDCVLRVLLLADVVVEVSSVSNAVVCSAQPI